MTVRGSSFEEFNCGGWRERAVMGGRVKRRLFKMREKQHWYTGGTGLHRGKQIGREQRSARGA